VFFSCSKIHVGAGIGKGGNDHRNDAYDEEYADDMQCFHNVQCV